MSVCCLEPLLNCVAVQRSWVMSWPPQRAHLELAVVQDPEQTFLVLELGWLPLFPVCGHCWALGFYHATVLMQSLFPPH